MIAIHIEADLSPRQFSKFKCLFKQMELRNGKAYFPTMQMHGVLLTNSRQGAVNIVQAHLKYVQPFIENINDDQYIKHIGVDVLLEILGEENPRKKIQYLAARACIAGQLANDPKIYKDAQLAADEQDRKRTLAVQELKKRATHCALSEMAFVKGTEYSVHVHHIEGVSEQPSLAADPQNLIPLTKKVHGEYHSWAIANQHSVTRATLKQFALTHKYSTNW